MTRCLVTWRLRKPQSCGGGREGEEEGKGQGSRSTGCRLVETKSVIPCLCHLFGKELRK